jgi:hypothetical protein
LHIGREEKIKFVHKFLQTEWLPQIGLSFAAHSHKAFYFAYILVELFKRACGFARPDSKDQYVNQRYDTNGLLLASWVRKTSAKLCSFAILFSNLDLHNS